MLSTNDEHSGKCNARCESFNHYQVCLAQDLARNEIQDEKWCRRKLLENWNLLSVCEPEHSSCISLSIQKPDSVREGCSTCDWQSRGWYLHLRTKGWLNRIILDFLFSELIYETAHTIAQNRMRFNQNPRYFAEKRNKSPAIGKSIQIRFQISLYSKNTCGLKIRTNHTQQIIIMSLTVLTTVKKGNSFWNGTNLHHVFDCLLIWTDFNQRLLWYYYHTKYGFFVEKNTDTNTWCKIVLKLSNTWLHFFKCRLV